jgi:hypothetical protein
MVESVLAFHAKVTLPVAKAESCITANKTLKRKRPKMARPDRINTSTLYITAVFYA